LPSLSLIDAPVKKDKKFVMGLNSPIRELLLTQVPFRIPYDVLVDMAILHENREGENGKESGNATSTKDQ